MIPRLFALLRTPLLAAWLVGFASPCFGAPPRPNVVFILTDDQNSDTLGCFGGKVLTPMVKRIAGDVEAVSVVSMDDVEALLKVL